MSINSLWGNDFIVEDKQKKEKNILTKVKNPKTPKIMSVEKAVKSKTIPIEEKLKIIKENVYKILGVYKQNTQVIKTKEDLVKYIDKAIENGIIAVDTETNNSLDPVTCTLMGGCLYTPGLKNAYIPINHEDLYTRKRFSWQITEEEFKEQLDRLVNTKIIYHNAKFDIQVIKCTCKCDLNLYWDTSIAAKILDENEHARLKEQYITKIDSSIEKYDITHLFENVEYAIVEPEVFALYAATDAFMTYKLYEYQLEKFKLPENKKLFELLNTVEIPLVKVIANLELAGMEVDQEYAKRLSAKYHKKLDKLELEINTELEKLKPRILNWRLTKEANFHPINNVGKSMKSKNEQLSDPINLGSPTQLAILFYDIFKCPQVSKKSPRGTGEEELQKIADKINEPICHLILKRRGLIKLINTYIDVIPELAKRWPDGRVRTHFNQYGAATGRLSSSEPLNFQNIPSHEKSIRLLFKAKDGYKIVGGDYSAQEPRLTAHYSNDEQMISAYAEGKDLYSVIASASFNVPYEDCLEFYPEGTEIEYEGKSVICGYKTHQNKSGKERRGLAKSILLGILYGRGAKSVGQQIHKTTEEAQEIIDKFFNAFPNVYKWIEQSKQSAYSLGYVEDVAGRRRRLPDITLPKYEITDKNSCDFNPLLFSKGIITNPNNTKIANIRNKLNSAIYKKDVDKIKVEAQAQGIMIKDNSGYIAQAERQCVNARVQGGAATLTKVALIDLANSEELKSIGATIINTVHDEILLEVPQENAERCAELLSTIMINSAKRYVDKVPMKTDTYIVNAWYEDEYEVLINEEYKKNQDKFKDNELALNEVITNHPELLKSQILRFLNL